MTPQQILIVAVRLFAIFWLLTSVGHFVTAFRTLEGAGPDGYTLFGILVPIFEFAACVFLWFFPATLSRRLLKGGDTPSGTVGPALLEWQSMIVIALGLWTLASAVPDAAYWIVYAITYVGMEYRLGDVIQDRWAYVTATLVQLILGLWLLLGARGFAALLFRIRTGGQ